MNLKIIIIFLALFLVIGQSCDVTQDKIEEENEIFPIEYDSSNPDDEFYDGLDSALEELEELEDSVT